MNTRCAIITRMPNGKYCGIYCHHDGYVTGVGHMLVNHYTVLAKVLDLIALGDISCLGQTTSNAPDCDCTIAYHRDNGEDWRDVSPAIDERWERVVSTYRQAINEYVYTFEPDSEGNWTWTYSMVSAGNSISPAVNQRLPIKG